MSPKPLNQISGMPQLQSALSGWTNKITLVTRTQYVHDGFVAYRDGKVTFKGVIQPLSPRMIQLKPEGQRSWTWLQIHCASGSLNLKESDQIVFNGTIYKIMGILDYSLNGYIEYHAANDYQP